ncbi:anthranilate phosphoribosyltransferase [Roseibacillus persicicus]|uniref:Anthranilate phosphoribosyltransferase n=1 Tax=Roseibacillus persicicus TaxID=454148 RepID=A0A918WHE7_9BACT|nr:anthranilate phosphoribosyltransferase [Roseibacillus persicicus]MDQ8191230.1 anthranilate phosphoribosyltransferase [Roseibacillus persicicus]GHC47896.1 anthranilate phosphoribosyltransferase [Roseibacillus persicicus]
MDTLISEVEKGQDLDERHVEASVDFLLDEGADDEKKAHFLKALAAKGETPAEIAAFVEAFLERSIPVELPPEELDGPTIDVCGTGGDGLNLFNVSTTSMFVIAAGGGVVVKHGNRGVTSKSGGADVLEALGVDIEQGPEEFRQTVRRAGVGFLYARKYHPAFKAVAPVRAQLAQEGVKTLFNLLGPLLNPCRPQCQLVGVTQRGMAPTFAEILQRLERESVWAVHGTTADGRGVDEVSLMGPTRICKSGSLQDHEDEEVSPADFGLEVASLEDLVGGDAKENAQILINILGGEEKGPRRDMVLLNAGAGLACVGLADDLGDGIEIARGLIASGEAMDRLEAMRG